MSTDDLSATAVARFAFIARYVRRRAVSHSCDLRRGARRRRLLDHNTIRCEISWSTRCRGGPQGAGIWLAFALLVSLIARDNLLWRVAS